MTVFQSLPPSILQAGAIFLSIMIEALPFVLIGSLISGLIEVYITPDKVYEFLPRNRGGGSFLVPSLAFSFHHASVESFQLSIVFWKRKCPATQRFPFW